MMDADTTDSATGELNGDSKPDAAKLAQNHIIKQDVMLSGTSTQSPVSSVLTMPTGSIPTMPTATMATSLTGVLPESLFLGAVPTAHENHLTMESLKNEMTSMHSALSHTSQPGQLLGQPPVAPQFILAGQGAASAAQTMPVQQLIIPVSAANGTQQLISIPLSLAASAGAGGQIQLLTTSNGQILATNISAPNIANLAASQLNIHMPTAGGSAVSPLLLVAPTVPTITPAHANPTSVTSHGLGSLAQHHAMATGTANNNAAAHAAAAAAQMPQLITNAQGQIVAIGTPQQMLQQTLPVAAQTSNNALLQAATQLAAQQALQHDAHSQVVTTSTVVNPQTLAPAGSLAAHAVPISHFDEVSSQAAAISQSVASLGAVSTTASMQIPVTSATHHNSLVGGVAGVTPNINQLLPNTISSAAEGTIVDGVNLDEIREFAKRFKIWRLSLGLTQTQVGQALSAREGPSYSQSAICRFEKLDITPKSAQKIKPVLERWMAEAEERYKNGMQNLSEFIGSEPSKKRKRRTSFTPSALEVLNEHFERNTHPSGAEMTELSEKLNYDREVIRVWFCNKRQALKNTIKKLKTHDSPS